MQGVKKIVFLIIPIALLLCFLAYGLQALFPYDKITYLTRQTITINGQQESYWIYDFETYMKNLNINYFKDSITDLKNDFESFLEIFNGFKDIWKEGYKWGNVVKTVANIIVILIDLLIVPINIFIIVTRIIAGILLTIFSLIGIDITNALTPLTAFNRWIVEKFRTIKMLNLYDLAQYKPKVTVPVIQ